ncbi:MULTISPECIES: hypothetical protein [unclassified Psychrobacter]|uniref:hypothetical protein n=1 Tax=unclassified Psychrobacter TaxID=196806 RepID=UPI00071E807D|nr:MULTISPECIES: hypothetical protein [unclassified Psychrobacter]OLF39439.1 hypothetical protein BTV98_03315 [Psychrobacter sp. Cmf 22.2]
MRVKNASRLRYQPAQPVCHASAFVHRQPATNASLQPLSNRDYRIKYNQRIGNSQRGASTWLLALFVVAILVTAIIAILLGHKLGYQRGYYALKTETEQATINSKEATNELKDLRISHKVLTNQVATAKQELTISLANLDDLRQKQAALKTDNRQISQLNDLYAEVIAEQGGMPLQVLGAKIEPLPENAFEYGFDVGMLSEDGLAKSLQVTLTLQNKDDFVEVPLDPARYVIEGIVRIRGRFVMPSGFKPLQVKLSLEAGDEQVEQLYDWKLGDMVDSMPLSLMDLPEVDQSPIEP